MGAGAWPCSRVWRYLFSTTFCVTPTDERTCVTDNGLMSDTPSSVKQALRDCLQGSDVPVSGMMRRKMSSRSPGAAAKDTEAAAERAGLRVFGRQPKTKNWRVARKPKGFQSSPMMDNMMAVELGERGGGHVRHKLDGEEKAARLDLELSNASSHPRHLDLG